MNIPNISGHQMTIEVFISSNVYFFALLEESKPSKMHVKMSKKMLITFICAVA